MRVCPAACDLTLAKGSGSFLLSINGLTSSQDASSKVFRESSGRLNERCQEKKYPNANPNCRRAANATYLGSDLGHVDGLAGVGYRAIVGVGGRVLLVEEERWSREHDLRGRIKRARVVPVWGVSGGSGVRSSAAASFGGPGKLVLGTVVGGDGGATLLQTCAAQSLQPAGAALCACGWWPGQCVCCCAVGARWSAVALLGPPNERQAPAARLLP